MAGNTQSTEPEDDENSIDGRMIFATGVLLFLAGVVSGAMLYAFGLAGRNFNIGILRGGLLTFGAVLLCVAAGVVVMTSLIRVVGYLWPRSLTIWSEHRLLRRSKKKTMSLLKRRHSLQEERARLTSKMQATYVMEKESARVANQQALQELRGALQSSMVRSCEIVFDHLNRTLDHYNDLVTEIELSDLPVLERKELLDKLSAKLNVEAQDQRRQSAQKMMETAIWEVRFRKARMMARHEVGAAVTYLRKIRGRTDSHRILMQIDAMIRELTAA